MTLCTIFTFNVINITFLQRFPITFFWIFFQNAKSLIIIAIISSSTLIFVTWVFFNCHSLYERLNSNYKAWNYRKKKNTIKTYRKVLKKKKEKEKNKCRRCLLTLDLKPFRSQVKGKDSAGEKFRILTVSGKKLLT